jgi:hypothetical protein
LAASQQQSLSGILNAIGPGYFPCSLQTEYRKTENVEFDWFATVKMDGDRRWRLAGFDPQTNLL